MKPPRRITSLILASFAFVLCLPTLAAAVCPAVTITTPTTIASGDLSYDNKDVVVQGTVLTVVGAHTFCSLTVSSGGSVNQVPTDVGGLDLTITTDCTVDGTSAITVAGLGYAGGAGPGSPGNGSPYCGGGAMGGEGGDGSGSNGSRSIYGSVTQPASLGSGGGWYGGASEAGPGGGAVHLTVTGTLHVDGTVSADGGAGLSSYGGGGSGGSLWLSAGTLEGAGTISANGGVAGTPSGGGGGSGGRVAIYYTTSTFTGTLQALGAASGTRRGGAGTVLTKVGSARATITIANTGGDLTNRRTIFAGQPLALDANLVVKDGGVLAPADQDSLWLSLTGNLTVEATGTVGADRRGFAGGAGPGSAGNGSPYCGGAAYGGDGGDGSGSSGSHGSYGSASQPRSLGSGGGWYGSVTEGGLGGGSLRLTVAGTLHVDGTVSADGGAGASSYGGGGSGGSLWLEVGTLEGTGMITSSGGAAGTPSGGGGGSGGRIAIYYTTKTFTGQLQALGGIGGQRGGAGTVLTKAAAGRAEIKVYNTGAGPTAARSTFRGDPITTNADVVSQDGGRLAPTGVQTFYSLSVVSGGTVTAAAGDTNRIAVVVTTNCTVDGTSAITVAGMGYAGGAGPGSPGNGTPYCGGGAYAGEGGDGSGSIGSRSIYGSVTAPTSLGSGGGWYGTASEAGPGGGAIHLTVTGTLHVDGTVSADGAAGFSSYGGGGSGGSLWLSAGTLEGAGTISANGGVAGTPSGGGSGSGGRIAIYYTSSTFSGTLQALGAASGTRRGGAGTVLTKVGSARATITIANTGGDLTNRRTILVGQPLTLDANLVVKDGGVLAPADQDSLWLSLTGNLTVEATGTVGADRRGFAGGAGPGTAGNGSPYCGGAAYGGDGGDGNGSGGSHGSYGSVSQPRSLGSGGGWYGSTSEGGLGGGSLRLTVAGTLHVDGTVNADGSAGASSYGGGGSGGSLWLEVGTLEGTGTISASGGAAGTPSGGGGGSGGRIAIYAADCFKHFDTANLVQVNGGLGGAPNGTGRKGTILLGYANSTIAGVEDEFLAPNEAASPSANLVAGLPGYVLVSFDVIPTDGALAHTFTGIPALTQAAKVVFRAKAGAGVNVAADKVTLGYSDAGGFHRFWSRYFGSTNPTGDASLTGRPWTTGKDTTLVIDVANLPRLNGPPVDATSLISAKGHLDLVVEGNTGVDYALLTYGTCGNATTGVGDPVATVPTPSQLSLRSAPNPFTERTQVTFELPRESVVRLAAYDLSGRRVRTLYEGTAAAGAHHLDWSGTSATGARLESGVYFIRLEAGGTTLMRKLLLAK